MALSEFELKKIEKEMDEFLSERRPPAHIRDRLDISYRIVGQSVEIFEIRPSFRNPGEQEESPVAKARYVRSEGHWNIYWQRADLKWHRYPPCPEVRTFREFLQEVSQDSHSCFFG